MYVHLMFDVRLLNRASSSSRDHKRGGIMYVHKETIPFI